MKIWWHKFRNWEYWSMYLVYFPTFWFWVFQMLRYRSFKFYQYSNPAIINGGFYGDSKMDIYRLLPCNLYPKTIKILEEEIQNLTIQNISKDFHFPCIVKPDIGCRGIGVQKVHSFQELIDYASILKKDFLIQELIDLPKELGLFYVRFPNQEKGKILGITLKKFLTIQGDGIKTIEELLKLEPRFEIQIPKLMNQIDLKEILKNGEERCLVPFGNHNRGTQFLDGSHLISPKLNNTFDNLLGKIEGFYFGRLDIRFNSFEQLERGENFKIIELNGAKSEPTHIYDPSYSFLRGQKEIFRYQIIMAKIIRISKFLSIFNKSI